MSSNPFRTLSRKYFPRNEFAEILSKLKAEDKTIVFTNGCFDILHVGHIRYLQDARNLGDILVVGVNSDSSVREIKGENRPINSEMNRIEVLSALECVDYVTIFDENLPTETILMLKPDIHTKGGDYEADDMPETPYVRSYGGKVVIIPLSETDSEGISTSDIIAKMNL